MDRRERIPARGTNAMLVAIQAALDHRQSNIWTALPAFVTAIQSGPVTVSAQPTIQGQFRLPNGVWNDVNMPVCVDCPIVFPGGGNCLLTFPIAENDEGVLVFSSRCIDSWWQSGGIQKQAELRMHDLSDGFFFPTGGLSQPNVIPDWSNTAVELRSKDGNYKISMDTTAKQVSLKSNATLIVADDTLGRASITAVNGLWVNGVKVTVP